MGFKCGIVGLPNVGKSTLFNALTRTAAAQAANYPFCTIEPNTGEVAVPDPRLQKIAAIAKSKEIIPTRISSSTSPGWCAAPPRVKGWAAGSSPTSTSRRHRAVLRCFEDDDITMSRTHRPRRRRRDRRDRADARRSRQLERRIVQIRARLRQGQGDDRAADDGGCTRTAPGR